MVNLAVVGLGYWGPNLLRNFDQLPSAEVRLAVDRDEAQRSKIARLYPHIRVVDDYELVLKDPEIQAVVIATEAASHYRLAKEALDAGKDVFVEKPITLDVADAEDLVESAERLGRVLMVGHLLVHHPAVKKLRGLMVGGELGPIYYVYGNRVNLGEIRRDESALWSLGPHDISVILYLLSQDPIEVAARGESYIRDGIQDVVFVYLRFEGKTAAHIHLSWLDPHKVRKITVVGSKKMVVFDDMEPTEKVKIYDKGAYRPDYDTYGEYVSLRFGDIHIPRIDGGEPLRGECEHFIECVTGRKTPVTDGRDGLRVLRVLEAAQRSMMSGGAPVKLAQAPKLAPIAG